MRSRVSSRDAWLTRNAPGNALSVVGTRGMLGRLPDGVSRLGHSGHVAHSEGFRRMALSVGFGDTWHSPKVSPKGLSVWVSGHVACVEGKCEGASGGGFGRGGRSRRKLRGGLAAG